MKPVGLTLKNIRTNPYTQKISGEIMLVHICLACGKISCNRVAGDDNAYSVIRLLTGAEEASVFILDNLDKSNVRLLTPDDEQMVSSAMLGNNFNLHDNP